MRHKYLLFILVCALFVAPSTHAQSVYFDFKFGAFYPAELPGGLYPNFALHKTLDRDGVLKWDLGIGAGYYRRSYRDLVYVANEPPNYGVSAAEIDFTRKILPLVAKLTMKISLVELNLPSFPGLGTIARKGMSKTTDLKDVGFLFRPYGGYFTLKSAEAKVDEQADGEAQYENWGWGTEIGIYLSTVQNVTTTISVIYNRITVDREIDRANPRAGYPIASEVKLNGYAFMLSMGWGF